MSNELYKPDTETFKLDVFNQADEAFFQLEFARHESLRLAEMALRRRNPDERGRWLERASLAEYQMHEGLREVLKYRDRKGQWL